MIVTRSLFNHKYVSWIPLAYFLEIVLFFTENFLSLNTIYAAEAAVFDFSETWLK